MINIKLRLHRDEKGTPSTLPETFRTVFSTCESSLSSTCAYLYLHYLYIEILRPVAILKSSSHTSNLIPEMRFSGLCAIFALVNAVSVGAERRDVAQNVEQLKVQL